MAEIRPYRAADLPSLYAICLQTGDRGADATGAFRDPELLGALYSAPYGVYAPDCCFVLEDGTGVGGYAVGAHDTQAFDAWMIRDWLAPLRGRLARPEGDRSVWDADQRVIDDLHSYAPTPEAITTRYPAHLHLNILTRLRRRGYGRRLAERWAAGARAASVAAAHIGVDAGNRSGLAFWRAVGFEPIPGLADAEGPENVFCGRAL